MDRPPGWHLPTLCDEDVTWACATLGFPVGAFGTADGSNPRYRILLQNTSMDVTACPGSGKTTLLVAKLAMLGRRWPAGPRGMAVLSHTNVARMEVERRLHESSVGQRVLTYPHFVGTIHSFVNEFLALPWMRSIGLAPVEINSETTSDRRWRSLPIQTQAALKKRHNGASVLRVVSPGFDLPRVPWGKNGELGRTTDTYLALQQACRDSCEAGHFLHDEMFVWARELLDRFPGIRTGLRRRFPLLFVDEAQDSDPLQSRFLFDLFSEGPDGVTRQRFGDPNQSIFVESLSSEGVAPDPFPASDVEQRSISDSLRFGPLIGRLCSPLGVEPVAILGRGPLEEGPTGAGTIILFSDETIEFVLPSFAEMLVESFGPRQRETGSFVAVGAVHTDGTARSFPRVVGHYWSGYDNELRTGAAPPKTLQGFVLSGRAQSSASGEAHHAVHQLAIGIRRLAMLRQRGAPATRRSAAHRMILDRLSSQPDVRDLYRECVGSLALGRAPVSRQVWESKWAPQLELIARAVNGAPLPKIESELFLSWSERRVGAEETGGRAPGNVYRYPPTAPEVSIRVGTIHSVKGETHTALLLLETVRHRHNLKSLLPWLTGEKVGGLGEGPQALERLRSHFVAMSRPTHLLCLAMKADTMSSTQRAAAAAQGWRIASATATGLQPE